MKMNLIFITFLLVFGDLFASEQTNITCKASALEEVGAKTHLHELKIISNSDLLSKVNNRLKEIELNSEYDYINTLERIANYLVETGQISEKDSRVVFAEKIFSDYDQIFFKFALAELYSRDFQKEDIENLLQSYNGLTNRQTQIEFAVKVAERMLYLVNDSPGMRSSAGIRQFKEMAEALGVSELTYKSFLGMWRYLISSKTELVLEYTLIQLRSLSENIVIENQRLEIEANDLRANLPAWKKIFGGADNISLPKSKFEIDLDIDQRLLVIGPFDFKNKSKYSFLSRYTGKKVKINQLKGLKELFDTVSLLVIDHVIINSIDQISYPVLLEFVETKEFESLSPSTQDKIRTKIHEYDHFKDLVTNLIKKQNEIEEGLKEIAEKKFDVNTLYKKHLKEFEEQLMVDIDSNSTANLAAKNLRRGLQNILTEVNIKENQ
ncbi:MAG: hypothetical protein VX642_04050, partial [Bdellovibrionota bacterium]|nr:hypothetical protein [Bdellovibrionota bacterium]